MTIEIQQPELEALIQERMASGNFASVEEFLRQTLDPIHLGATQGKGAASPNVNGRKLTLDEVFGLVRGLADDVDFSRDRSLSRPLDLGEGNFFLIPTSPRR